MADTKMTKSVGEHWAASELARRSWAPAFTRDGLERTDILAVKTIGKRLQIEVQVKAANGRSLKSGWPLGEKTQRPPLHEHEWFVLALIDPDVSQPIRGFVVPRSHIAAAAWIAHMDWLTEEGVPAGQRNAGVDRARVYWPTFRHYENRWDLLDLPTSDVPVLLPPEFRDHALTARVGLPPDHPWNACMPVW